MSVEKKKISLDRFQKYSRQVVSLVNSEDMEVVIYGANGPVARIIPYSAAPMSIEKTKIRPMDFGGVWYIDDDLRKNISKPKGLRRRLKKLTQGGVWKLARVSAILPFLTRA